MSVFCAIHEYDNVTTPYNPISALYLSSGHFQEVKNEVTKILALNVVVVTHVCKRRSLTRGCK